MELIKKEWKKEDINDFQDYLRTLGHSEKVEWSKSLLKTSLPVLVIKTIDIKNIVASIREGNYLSFLDLMLWEYYENTAINGLLINLIDDFNLKMKYLDIYSDKAENWATCDLLCFNVTGFESEYIYTAKKYSKSIKPFKRRIGMYILFNFIDKEEYINTIFEMLDEFNDEEDYYVNMMNSWLICECFIKQKEKTLKYLEKNKLNKFTINRAIQKCRESNRVTKEDKEMLLKYKVKRNERKTS